MYEGSQIKELKNTVTNKDGKAYCLECGKRTKYYISYAIQMSEAWCKCTPYLRINARCGICGKEVFIKEIEEANKNAKQTASKIG